MDSRTPVKFNQTDFFLSPKKRYYMTIFGLQRDDNNLDQRTPLFTGNTVTTNSIADIAANKLKEREIYARTQNLNYSERVALDSLIELNKEPRCDQRVYSYSKLSI